MKKNNLLTAAILLMLICSASALSTESQIRQDGDRVLLSTADGFCLALDARDGTVLKCRSGDREISLKVASLVRFEEVIELPDAPDLLGGMSPEDWGMPAEALQENAEGQPGPWLRVQGGKDHPKQAVSLKQATAQPLVLSGWCQTRVSAPVLGWLNRSLALNATGVYTDGERLGEVSACFGQYQHGPQFNKCIICPDRPLAELQLELTAIGGLDFLTGPLSQECTAWYRNVQLRPAQYRITEPRAPLKRIDSCLIQQFDSSEAGLRSWITFQPMEDCIEIRGIIESTKPEDRAISAYVSLPLDAVGGRWHDHFRAARVIKKGKVYRDEGPPWYYGVGRDGRNSDYPLACVDVPNGPGLAIATAVDEPRTFQTEYNAAAKVLRIRFDLGLSPDAGKHANRATFTARVFAYDTSDGFRGATEKYHHMYAWAFKKRVKREGNWLAFLSPAFVPGDPADFHFQFVEGVSNMGWEEQNGIYSLRYTLPFCHVQEVPAHIDVPEVHGPAVPAASLSLAKRILTIEGLPLEMYRRYQAFSGSYVTDKWGQPDGFFYRSVTNTPNKDYITNRNHIYINPNCELPAPAKAPFSYGGWEREMIREDLELSQQWSVPGWRIHRVETHPFVEIDMQNPAQGKQSLRMEPVENKSFNEQYKRGVSQCIYLDASQPRPITVSLKARCDDQTYTKENKPRCLLTFWNQAAKRTSKSFPLAPLTTEWQSFTFETDTPASTAAITIHVDFTGARSLRGWIDNVSLTVDNGPNLLKNGGFEDAELLPCRMDGLYLDLVEGSWGEMNYRRDHWRYAETPLTFDSARDPTLLQVYTHTTFARQMAQWLRPKDMFLFGNMAPTTPFTAPYLDAMGTEQFWKRGEKWTPTPDKWFNYVRFMCRTKPFCILQYSDLSVEEEARYMKRCLFYGIFPTNQADPDGQIFWANPVVVARHRPVFKKFAPLVVEIAKAGWQPLTLAKSDNENIWLERFGAGDLFYLTAFNPKDTPQRAVITLDSRAGITTKTAINERLSNQCVSWNETESKSSFTVTLNPEDVAIYRVSKQ